jgi:hypothetical protein
LDTSLDYITDTDNVLETRQAQAIFSISFTSGDLFTSSYTRNYELLRDPFEIADDVTIVPGGYSFHSALVSYTMGPLRPVKGRVQVSHGSFYDGERTEVSYNGRIDLRSHLSLEPRVAFNWVDLTAGSFLNRLVSTRTIFTVSPRTAFSALLQFNSSTNTLSMNHRFRWEYQPGSELFVVYSDGRDTSLSGFPSLVNRTFAVKLTRLFRF